MVTRELGDTLNRRQGTIDRRRWPRIEVLGDFHGQSVSLGVPVKLLDVSRGGFQIETSVMLPLGATLVFRFTVPDSAPIELSARALRCSLHRSPRGTIHYTAGLEFIGSGATTHADIERLIVAATSPRSLLRRA